MTPVAAEARVLYKQAQSLLRPPSDPARLRIARLAFERVIEADPAFAGGYAGVALMDAFYVLWGHSQSPEEDIQNALKFSDKAIEVDPSLGLVFSASAFANWAQRDFDTALAASSQAVRIQPNDPYVNAYHGFLLCSNGQAKGGIEFAKRALRLDPLVLRRPYLSILGIIYFHDGQYQEALNVLLKNTEPGRPYNPAIQAYLVATYASLGRRDEARTALEVLNMYDGDFVWEDWIRRTFRYERDVELLMRPIRDLGMD